MKKWIVAALVLVACLLLAPFGFGKLAEKRVNSALDALMEQAPYLVISDRSWEGGWFSSRQQVTFEVAPAFRALIAPALGESGEASFKAINDVVHGPVLGAAGFGLARVDTTLDLSEEVQAELGRYFGPEPPLEVHSRLGFFSGGSTTVASKGRTINADDEAEISYDDFEFRMGFGRNGDSYTLKGEAPRFEVKVAQGGSVQMTGVTATGRGKRALGKLFDGNMDMRVGGIKVDPPGGPAISIADLHYVVDTATKDGFTDMMVKLGSGAVENPQADAMGLEIKEIHYNFSLRHLHSGTLEKLATAMNEMYKAVPPEGTDPAEAMAAIQEQVVAPLVEHAGQFLEHDPGFGLDRVGVVTPEGEAVVRGVVNLKGATIDDFAFGALGLLSKIDVDLTIEIAQKLADKIPNGALVVGMGISQGYVTRDGEKLVCHIEFRNGELKVNGKAQVLPIPGMVAPPSGGGVAVLPEI